MSSDARELEITLVIRAEDPARVVTLLEALEHLGGHALHHEPSTTLHDRYFDFASGAREPPGWVLRSIGFALRLRESASRWQLCLKGASRRRGLAVERVEIEGALDDPTLAGRMAVALAGSMVAGMKAGPPSPPRPGADAAHQHAARSLAALGMIDFFPDPMTAMARAGWSLIQDRETLRRPRTVSEMGATTHGIAVLAIDTVTYSIASRPLFHHEVEIEAIADTDTAKLDELARLLRTLSPAALQPWRFSKLRTGAALAALAARLGPGNLANATGDLLPATYDLLAAEPRGV